MARPLQGPPAFRVQPIPAAELARIRRAGEDDFGHSLRVVVNRTPSGTPMRCCLREAAVGEEVALIAYRPLQEAPDSLYAEVGPVFVHGQACAGYRELNSYPAGFRHRSQVLRAYSSCGDMLDAELVDGGAAEEAIARLLGIPGTAVLHSRNVAAGCFMFAIHRR